MKDKLKIVFAVSLFVVIYLLGIYCLFENNKNEMNRIDKKELNIGKQIVLGVDTLIITNYNSSKSCFILSNGAEVSEKLVEKLVK